jgi:hypothetical protein
MSLSLLVIDGVASSGELLVAYRISDLLDYEESHAVSFA